MTRQPVRVMLDSNIWSYIADEQVRAEFDRTLVDLDLALVLAPSVLLEVLRTPNSAVRERIVGAMISGKPARHLQSEAESESQEILAEVRRLRPQWLRTFPDTRRSDRFHRFWTTGIWAAVERDLGGFVQRLEALNTADPSAGIVEGQRLDRRSILQSKGDWRSLEVWAEPALDTPAWYLNGWGPSKSVEAWRVASRDVAWAALTERRRLTPEGVVGTTYDDFIEARADRGKMVSDREDFSAFWFVDVSPQSMRRWWLRWAIDYAQTLFKITAGNARDAQHGSYLVECDFFLTADRGLASVLGLVSEAAPFKMAETLLVSRLPDESVVTAIERTFSALHR